MTHPHVVPGQETQAGGWDSAMVDPPSYFFGRLAVSWRWVRFENDPPGSKNWSMHEYQMQPGPDGEQVMTEQSLQEFQQAENADYGSGIFNSKQATFNIVPLNPTLRPWKREFSLSNNKKKEWRLVIRPAIESVAEQVAAIKGLVVGQFTATTELDGMFVSGERVLNPDNKNKEDNFKTMKFEKVYPDETACRAAWEAWMSEQGREIPGAPVAVETIDPAVRASLVPFLAHFWEKSKGERLPLTAFLKHLQSETMAPAGFTLADPECVAFHAATPDMISSVESGEEIPF